MKLVIVESPGKVGKVQSFLGGDFIVMASYGHVRDLPTAPGVMGVEPPDFRPQYVPTERGKRQIAILAEAAKKAEAVYLGSDQDREGEAIAWHLMDALGLKNPLRITYSEITAKAVKEAIAHPRQIDMDLVAAQEGRRALDRLVGYTVSYPVSKYLTGQGGLSVGRVQTPALRLVVDRERAIAGFRQTTHFGAQFLFGQVQNIDDGWRATWDTGDWLPEGETYCLDQDLAQRIAQLRSFTVASYEESEARQAPPAPFTTATLQQAASNALGFSPTETMALAQQLYQNGHITYMRTDSKNLCAEAMAEARSLASQHDWPVPPQPRTWKNEADAQEAHEAIRPTHFEVEEAGDNDRERALYKLIRLRALASQLCDTEYAVTKAVLDGELDGRAVTLKASGRRVTKPGWRVLLATDQSEEESGDDGTAGTMPKLQEGQVVTATSGAVVTKKTKPPTRFTEASLVGELKRRGIGRPSTYASIVDLIQKRGYAKLEKRFLVPTEVGQKIIEATEGLFKFADYGFTKAMEAELDKIAAGQGDYVTMMASFYESLNEDLAKFDDATSYPCPDCGGRLIHYSRKAAPGKKAMDFFGCAKFPACRAKFENDGGKPGARIASATASGHKCPKCGEELLKRQGVSKKNGQPYTLFTCPNKECGASFWAKKDGSPDFNPKPKK